MPTLQEQINATPSGGTLTLPDGSEHVGNFEINKSISLRGRAKLISPNAGPALDIVPKTRGVNLTDISLTGSGAQIYDIFRIGAWQVNTLADVPADITLTRVDVFGNPGQEVQRGIAANGANVSLFDVKVREIHGRNAEAQAIAAWNTPGPFTMWDCYFEASHIGLLFGGAEAHVPNVVPTGIDLRRIHFFRPLTWRNLWPCKNHLEFKNAKDVIVDGCLIENSWVSAQIGYAILATVRNEEGKNPWAVVKNIVLKNFHIKNCAGGIQFIGKDTNPAGTAGAGSDLTLSNVIFELSQEMGGNGRLLQIQDFNNLTADRIESNASHSYLNFSGSPVSGLRVTNSLLAQGSWGVFGDSDRPLSFYAPDAQISGNVIYGPTGNRTKYPGNTYVDTRPTTLPAGVGVDLAALKAAMVKPDSVPSPTPIPEPTPAPTPTPTPVTSPNGTKAVKIVDASGKTWTIGLRRETLRDGIHIAGGYGTVYKWQDSIVYVLGEDNNWWRFNGSGWEKYGAAEPGVTEPLPQPEPSPVPTPTPAPVRVLLWPSTESGQTTLWQNQAKEGYRPNKHVARPSNMPKGNYVEFVKY